MLILSIKEQGLDLPQVLSANIGKNQKSIVKPRPKTQTPKAQPPTQSNPVKISSKGTGADTKILWAK